MNYKHLIYIISFFVPICAAAHGGDNSPVEFIRNDGQWEGPFLYKARYGNVELYLEQNRFTYQVGAEDNVQKIYEFKHSKEQPDKYPLLKYHAYRVNMLGANTSPEVTGSKEQPHYYNYYLGSDTSTWKDHIYPNLAIDYTNIYNNIDLHIASESRTLKYDFIVRPGGNPDDIALEFEGVEDIKIKSDNIVITTSVGEIYEMAPFAYQYESSKRKKIACKYRLKGNVLSYVFPKGYNNTVPLIIDPTVVFATFTGATSDNWGFTATYDAAGNFYAGGIVSGAGYPSTIGPNYSGGTTADSNFAQPPAVPFLSDMGITKFNPNGTAIIYSTFIGGSSQDQPHSMIVDNSNALYIAGRSYSSDYPVTTSSYSGGADIVVTKLAANGTLANSRFMGGSLDDGVNISSQYGNIHSLKHSYADDARSEILIDNSGNVYVAGCSKSNNFPTANATKSNLTGLQDGVVFKLSNNLTNIIWSTYIGGSSVDAAYVLALNNNESSIYVSGGTSSGNFTGSGGLWNTYQGGDADGFIIKYQNSGNYPIQNATLIGRGGYDQCFGIQVDNNDNVYVNGQTLGGGFPVTSGVYSNASSSQFLMKLNSDLNTNIYSTVYGSGNSSTTDMTPVAFLVDTCENVYISGWGGSVAGNGGNVANMPIKMTPTPTPTGVLSATTVDDDDFYFIVFSKDAANLLFAAYYGGTATGEHVDGGTSRFDENGVVYQAICGGCGGSSNVPTTTGALSRTNGSANCNLIALKIEFNLGAVAAKATANPSTTVCLGDPVNFSSAGSSNVSTYEWTFGDGNTSTQANPTHTYTSGGTYQVKLVVKNPVACRVIDSAQLTIIVDSNAIDADFDIIPTDSCKPFIATINNTSKESNAASTTYEWNFGDGKTFSGKTPGTHEYEDTGTYTVTLIMTDPNACNQADTVIKTISFNSIYVEASFGGPPVICERTKAVFNNNSINAATYLWTFGDGNTSNDASPEHIYDTAGTYTVVLRAYNPATCNQADSLEMTVTVEGTPVAAFRHSPIIPVTNDPIIFTNQSLRATSYVWDFGDDTYSQLHTPEPKFYRRTGTYRVCLQAQNEIGCSDTVCRNVDADVYPLADLPKAFSPNGDGSNDVLYVRGAGIEEVNLKIYNRWGEMIFETTDMDIGWDGKYKGKEQPVEAYAYVLNVVFVDGTTFYKKGNVTLLR